MPASGGHLLRHLARAPRPACARLLNSSLRGCGCSVAGRPCYPGWRPTKPGPGNPRPTAPEDPDSRFPTESGNGDSLPGSLSLGSEHRFPAKSEVTGRGNGHWGFPGLTKPAARGSAGDRGSAGSGPSVGGLNLTATPGRALLTEHRCPGRGFMGTAAPARRTLPCRGRVQRAARPYLQAKPRARGPGARGPDRQDAQRMGLRRTSINVKVIYGTDGPLRRQRPHAHAPKVAPARSWARFPSHWCHGIVRHLECCAVSHRSIRA